MIKLGKWIDTCNIMYATLQSLANHIASRLMPLPTENVEVDTWTSRWSLIYHETKKSAEEGTK